jgi:hypothetical protein
MGIPVTQIPFISGWGYRVTSENPPIESAVAIVNSFGLG